MEIIREVWKDLKWKDWIEEYWKALLETIDNYSESELDVFERLHWKMIGNNWQYKIREKITDVHIYLDAIKEYEEVDCDDIYLTAVRYAAIYWNHYATLITHSDFNRDVWEIKIKMWDFN